MNLIKLPDIFYPISNNSTNICYIKDWQFEKELKEFIDLVFELKSNNDPPPKRTAA